MAMPKVRKVKTAEIAKISPKLFIQISNLIPKSEKSISELGITTQL